MRSLDPFFYFPWNLNSVAYPGSLDVFVSSSPSKDRRMYVLASGPLLLQAVMFACIFEESWLCSGAGCSCIYISISIYAQTFLVFLTLSC